MVTTDLFYFYYIIDADIIYKRNTWGLLNSGQIHISNKYKKHDQQGRAAFNERILQGQAHRQGAKKDTKQDRVHGKL
jgi:hypothetical protein